MTPHLIGTELLPLARDDGVLLSIVSDPLAIIRPLATTSSNFSNNCFNLKRRVSADELERHLSFSLTSLQVCPVWQYHLAPFLQRADRFRRAYRWLVDEPIRKRRSEIEQYLNVVRRVTVPFESETSLQIKGTSLFSWIVDAPYLSN